MSAYGDFALSTCDGRMLPSFCSGLAIVSKYENYDADADADADDDGDDNYDFMMMKTDIVMIFANLC